jgi:hypothetical protein
MAILKVLSWHPLTAGIVNHIPAGIFVPLEGLLAPTRILECLQFLSCLLTFELY